MLAAVDDFRLISHQMLASHFRDPQEPMRVGRVEFLPVRWHSALHGDATGIDRYHSSHYIPFVDGLKCWIEHLHSHSRLAAHEAKRNGLSLTNLHRRMYSR